MADEDAGAQNQAGEGASAQEQAVADAHEEAERLSTAAPVLGKPGPPIGRRSPFVIGFWGALGVGVAYELGRLLQAASGVLVLVAVALFLAIGLEPAVAWLGRTRMPRALAVPLVALLIIGVLGGFLALALPPLIAQVGQFVDQLPVYISQMRDHSTTLGHLDARYHIEERVRQALSGVDSSAMAGEVVSAGRVVLSTTFSIFTVLVLTVYLMFDLPRIRRLLYRLTPASRRARVILIGDEISGKVGHYVLGNLVTSLIAGVGTTVWLLIFHVPYPIVLGIMVALFDLIPIIGSTIAGIIVSLIALTVSLPVAIATAVFYIAYRLLEDYLIVPRVIGRAVSVPAVATILAVLIGGAAGGLLGALVAIPVAAAIDIILRETVFPRLDRA
ncbi:AI-2E family transporter [Hamadaea tsunoensis]|uniref:AI-2E family transporter n=1 Tax=Hamadaea tsunoensis TaxID=53368 RepID=UPI0004202C2E|nr:AI-2E family transporter [Hamadaea tsunoensis]